MTDVAPAASFNFADIWESTWPLVAEREALVCGPQRRTYGDLAARTNRLAHALRAEGVGPGDRVGLFLRNDVAYLEAMLAAFTLRAVPVNMNHRYTGAELGHLVTDSGARILLAHRSLVAAVATVPDLDRHVDLLLLLDDVVPERSGGAVEAGGAEPAVLPRTRDYEAVLAASSPEPVAVEGRSGDDEYLLYTGGTTGRPKGVRWRQEDAFFGCIGGGDPLRLQGPVTTTAELQERIVAAFTYFPVAPLMHAAAQWTTLSWLFCGGRVVLPAGSLDPEAIWQAVHDEGVNTLTLIGDAVGRPVIAAWEANPGRWRADGLFSISNGGAPMSPTLKARIGAAFPSAAIVDGFGSSESGVQGSQRLQGGEAGTGLARFAPGPNTGVFDDDLRPVEPGSGVIGRVANAGRLPIGYLNDPEKTAATFVEIDGRRHCFTGDLATVEADGTIQLLGRGSQCINTGGEKVFPEEVEGVLVDHPAVRDVLVVGVADDRWGSAVTAIVEPVEGEAAPDLDGLREFARGALAGYKLPQRLVVVERVRRSPAGKADYRWAKEVAGA